MKFTKKGIELEGVINRVDFSDHKFQKVADAMTYIGIITTGVGFCLAIAGEMLRRGSRETFVPKDNDGVFEMTELYACALNNGDQGFFGSISN